MAADLDSTYDVVTLGETMLRLTPPNMMRFEQASMLELHVGGSESNTAVGLARLGLKVAWLSRMTDNPIGRHVVDSIHHHHVDTTHVCWTDKDRVGLYYLESGKPPRNSQVIYDRSGSAMANMQPSDLPNSLFQEGKAKLFHTSGITLGVSQSASATAMRAIELAKSAGWKVSFDVNYRSRLWDAASARRGIDAAMRLADVIFLPYRDAQLLFDNSNIHSTHDTVIELLTTLFPQSLIVMTLGSDGAMAATPQLVLRQNAYRTETVERLGGGDAFSAGFLAKYLPQLQLDAGHLQECLKWGCATASLKYTIPGDLPLVDIVQVQRIINANDTSSIQR